MENGGTGRDRARGALAAPRRRGAVDGLIVGGREVWVVVARSREDVAELFAGDGGSPGDAPLRLCRAVLEGGVLLLGESDPDRDPLISDLMRHDEQEHS